MWSHMPKSILEDTILLLHQDAHWKISTSCSGSWCVSCPMIFPNNTHIPLASWANLVTPRGHCDTFDSERFTLLVPMKASKQRKTLKYSSVQSYLCSMKCTVGRSKRIWKNWGKYVHTHTQTKAVIETLVTIIWQNLLRTASVPGIVLSLHVPTLFQHSQWAYQVDPFMVLVLQIRILRFRG